MVCIALLALSACTADKCAAVYVHDSASSSDPDCHFFDDPTKQGGGMPDSNAVMLTDPIMPINSADNSTVDTETFHKR